MGVTQEIGPFQHLLTIRILVKIRAVNLRSDLKALLKKCTLRRTRQCDTDGRLWIACSFVSTHMLFPLTALGAEGLDFWEWSWQSYHIRNGFVGQK